MDICCGLTKETVIERHSVPPVTLVFLDGVKITGIELPNIFEAARAWSYLPDHNMKTGELCPNSRGKKMRGLTEGGLFAWGQISAFCEEGCGQFTIARIDNS